MGRQAASGGSDAGATAPAASAPAAQTPSSGGVAAAPEDNILQVKNLGWFDDNGFAYAVYEVTNTSDDLCVSPVDMT